MSRSFGFPSDTSPTLRAAVAFFRPPLPFPSLPAPVAVSRGLAYCSGTAARNRSAVSLGTAVFSTFGSENPSAESVLPFDFASAISYRLSGASGLLSPTLNGLEHGLGQFFGLAGGLASGCVVDDPPTLQRRFTKRDSLPERRGE